MRRLTFVAWFQLGELRRFSIGEISESGRPMLLPGLYGVGIELVFVRRNGCTLQTGECAVSIANAGGVPGAESREATYRIL